MKNFLCSLLICIFFALGVFGAATKAPTVPKTPAPAAPKTPAAPKAATPAAAPAAAAPAAASPPASNATEGPTGPAGMPAVPVSTQLNSGIGSLDYYYLLWTTSYSAGDSMDFQLVANPGKTPPTTVAISVYDEFNKVKLSDIAKSAALTASPAGQPFSLYKWQVPTTLQSNFDFTSGYFTIVLSWTEAGTTITKERRLMLNNVKATPGGKPNPALGNAVGGTSAAASSSKSAAAPLLSAFTKQSIFAFVIFQVAAILLF